MEGQLQCEEKAAARAIPAHKVNRARECGSQAFAHDVSVPAIIFDLELHKPLQSTALLLQDSRDKGLQQGRRIDRKQALYLGELLCQPLLLVYLLVGDEISQPQSGEQRLGKATDIEHYVFLIQRLQCGKALTFIDKHSVRIVLDDQDIVARAHIKKLPAMLQRH